MKRNCMTMFLAVVFVVFFSTFSLAASTESVVVKRGDTMWDISLEYGVSFKIVIALNHKRFKNVNLIYEGDVVLIPKVTGVLFQEKAKVSVLGVDNIVAKEISVKQNSAKTNHVVKENYFSVLEMKILKTLGFIALILTTFFVVRRILPYFFRENWESSYGCEITQKEVPEEIFNSGQKCSEDDPEKNIGNVVSEQVRKNNQSPIIPFVNKLKNKFKRKEKPDGFIALSKETKKFTFVGFDMYTSRDVSGWCACKDLAGLAKYMVFARGKVVIEQNIFEIPEYLEDKFSPLSDLQQRELRKLTSEFDLGNIGGPLNVVWKSISNE